MGLPASRQGSPARKPETCRSCFVAWGFFVLLALTGCDGGCARRDAGPGGLAVALTIPQDAVDEVTSIDVLFDQPMVAVGDATARVTESPFTIHPRVKGRFRWIGTRTASFVPEQSLASATRYEGRVPAGTRAVNGKTLPKDHLWSFETPRPTIVRVFPEIEVGASEFGPDLRLVLEFNQPVAPSVVRRAARLTSGGGLAMDLEARRPGQMDKDLLPQSEDVSFRLGEGSSMLAEGPSGLSKDRLDRLVVLVPRRPLTLDTEWRLEIAPGLVGLEGSLPMEKSWQRSFRTYGPFVADSLTTSPWQSNALMLSLSNEVDTDSLLAHATTDPPVRLRGAWQEWDSRRVTLHGDFRPGRTYRLILRAGLADIHGQPLQTTTLAPVTIRDAKPEVTLFPDDAVIQRSDRREMALILTNVQEARLSMTRINAAAIGRTSRYSLDDEWRPRGAGGDPTTRIVTRRTRWNEPDTLFLSTDEVLGAGQGGTVLVRVESLDPPKPIPGAFLPDGSPRFEPPARARAMVRVSDLGLTGKTSTTNHLFWLTSLSSGKPVAGARVEVRTATDRLVWSGMTGSNGVAPGLGLPIALGKEWPLHAIATTDNDQVWLTLGGDWNLEPWNFGLPGGRTDREVSLDGMIYGDRDLYRPGETVHLKGVLRQRLLGGLSNPGTILVRIEMDDPRGNPVVRRDATLSRFGTMQLDWPLDAAAMPGTWSVRIVPPVRDGENRSKIRGTEPGPDGWSLDGSFTVAEYRAPEFKVNLAGAQPWALSGQALAIDVTANYFFGAPLREATVRWSLSRRPFEFRPPGFDDYSFADHEATPEFEWLVGRGEVQLDVQGRATLSPLADLGSTPVSLIYTMEVEARDQTGRASSAVIERPIHRGLAYPGVAVSSQLVPAGDKIQASIILLDPDGRSARNATAQVRLLRRDWRTVRRLLVGGIIGSESTMIDTVIDRRALPTGAGPHRMEFAVPTAGYYRVVVEATDGTKNKQQSAATFFAAGPGDYAWGWEPGVRLDLVADRTSYAPGDTARVLVRAPFAGATALITVEREGIRQHETRTLRGTSEILEVPIPRSGSSPNLYLSVALILGSDARKGADPRLVKPEFRLGLINLPVDHRDQRLHVQLRPNRLEAGPGDSITIDLGLVDVTGVGVRGEVSVAIVDEAVLRLLGTTTPDPLGWFYRPRPLSVTTSEVRREVVRTLGGMKAKGGDPGGGGGDGISFRSAFATTALWKADLVTDAGGHARIGVRLPDNLTTFRVMAVALDEGSRFGSSDTTIVVTKPLLVQAALPRFATVGDHFRGGAIIHNRTAQPMTIDVVARATGLDIIGTTTISKQSIPANGSRRVDVDLAARHAGRGTVGFHVTGGGLADGIEVSIPVVDPIIERHDAATGLATARVEEVMALPASARPESARVTVLLASSLMGGNDPAFRYLEQYPYRCLEQQASRAWSRILEARIHPDESRSASRLTESEAARKAVEELAPYQTDDGGFVLYPGQGTSEIGLTSWALLALQEARLAGADTERLSTPALRYLAWKISSESSDTSGVAMRAADWSIALWAMSGWPLDEVQEDVFRQTRDFLTTSSSRLSQDSRLSLALAWSADSYRPSSRPGAGVSTPAGRLLAGLLNQVEQVADLASLREDRSTRRTNCWEWWWGSPERTNALYLLALLDQPIRSPLEPKVARKLLESRQGGRWGNTQGNMLSLSALAAYGDQYERERPDVTVRLTLGSVQAEPVHLTDRQAPVVARTWPAPPVGNRLPLIIERSGAGALYYTAALHYRESSVGRPAEESLLTLTRAWESLDGGSLLTSGELVVVRLTLVVPEALNFLVLADPLPAGLEPVQLEFRTSSQEAGRRMNSTARSDRRESGLRPSFTEVRDREVRAYFDQVSPGVHEYRYLARAVTPGQFGAPRARAELMYHPEVAAFTDGPTVTIAPR